MSGHHFAALVNGQVRVYFDTPDKYAIMARDHVLEAVTARLDIPPGEVLGKSRVYGVVYARKLTAAALRAIGFTYAAIGAVLDRHHATIMHGISEILGMARFDQEAADDLVWAIQAADDLAGTKHRKEASA